MRVRDGLLKPRTGRSNVLRNTPFISTPLHNRNVKISLGQLFFSCFLFCNLLNVHTFVSTSIHIQYDIFQQHGRSPPFLTSFTFVVFRRSCRGSQQLMSLIIGLTRQLLSHDATFKMTNFCVSPLLFHHTLFKERSCMHASNVPCIHSYMSGN